MKIPSASWYLVVAVSTAVAAGTGARTQPGSKIAQGDTEFGETEDVDPIGRRSGFVPGVLRIVSWENGKGDGPVAPALKATAPDLTAIAKNNGGKFPVARVRRIITGEGMVASHGSREMPVWGPIFSQVEADVDRGPVRLENLVKYLESIQSIK